VVSPRAPSLRDHHTSAVLSPAVAGRSTMVGWSSFQPARKVICFLRIGSVVSPAPMVFDSNSLNGASSFWTSCSVQTAQ
jgi:hypothetical protein